MRTRAICKRLWCAAVAAAMVPVYTADADPPLPVFGSTVYNISVANAAINGGVAASTASADNAAAINAYVAYCSAHGGGTVEIPAGTYLSSTVTLQSNVNLKLDASSILRDTSIANKLITTTGTPSNIEISGSGTIDGGATTTVGSVNLVDIRNVTTLAIVGVSIVNAGHEHLVPINITNLTISNVNINDAGTLAANSGAYLANTDGIDYSGNNILISNCVISDGDDDIVAKPASNACNNVTITGCTIGAGHGISIGGGSAKGVVNMLVQNCTMNGTDNGLRMKAADVASSDQDAGGGITNPVKNVTFNNITMTNVGNPIIIDTFYDTGGNNFPSGPTDATRYPAVATAVDATTPMWENIAFDNITVTGSPNAGLIYGLNSTPDNIEGLSFSNVNISASSHMNLFYANGVDYSGLHITVPGGDPFANAAPVAGAQFFAVTAVPEPASIGVLALGTVLLLSRRSRRRLL